MTTNIKKRGFLSLFKLLSYKKVPKQEILEKLNIMTPTFYKYLAKYNDADFKIQKIDNFYQINIYKNVLKLNEPEKSAIAYMMNIARIYLPDYKYKIFRNFCDNFLMLSNSYTHKEIYEKYNTLRHAYFVEEFGDKINILERFMKEKKDVVVTLKNKKEFFITPLKFDYKKDNIVLVCEDKIMQKDETILLKNIVKISSLKGKKMQIQKNEIIYELTGRLASTYLLKQNERIISSSANSLKIACKYDNKSVLFKRLLRYDTLCRVLFPKTEVQEFKKLIDKSIENIK
ncbi:hypothetical protein IJ670_00260 [bacterium]|nr:hypothetical protein [bacterium]